jgi:hypothetical protein
MPKRRKLRIFNIAWYVCTANGTPPSLELEMDSRLESPSIRTEYAFRGPSLSGTLPDEAVFGALVADLQDGYADRSALSFARRMNFELAGFTTMISYAATRPLPAASGRSVCDTVAFRM